ncbi:unnamed protein product [Pedinophyceae sp. YPF-701]|nr:unnamed protein product [Pedinophyceae sp. YPF-701]
MADPATQKAPAATPPGVPEGSEWSPVGVALFAGDGEGADASGIVAYVQKLDLQLSVVTEADLMAAAESNEALMERVTADLAEKGGAVDKKKAKGKKGAADDGPVDLSGLSPALLAELFHHRANADREGDLRGALKMAHDQLKFAEEDFASAKQVLEEARQEEAGSEVLGDSRPSSGRRLTEQNSTRILADDDGDEGDDAEADAEDAGRRMSGASHLMGGPSMGAMTEVGAEAEEAQVALERAQAKLEEAQAAVRRPVTASRLYLLPWAKLTAERLTEVLRAGVPFRALVVVGAAAEDKDAAAEPAPESVEAVVAALEREVAAAAWGDPVREMEVRRVELGGAAAVAAGEAVGLRKSRTEGEDDAEAPAPPAGALEVAGALGALRSEWVQYTAWLAEASVLPVPAMPAEDLDRGIYDRLMSTVPPENASVAVMVHCMVEQAAHAAVATGAADGPIAERGKQADAISFVSASLSNLFDSLSALPAADSIPAAKEHGLVAQGFHPAKGGAKRAAADGASNIVGELDRVALRACGAHVGYRVGPDGGPKPLAPLVGAAADPNRSTLLGVDVNADDSVSLDLQVVTDGGWRSMMTPEGHLDVEAVEKHMLGLCQLPGFGRRAMPAASELDEVALSERAQFLKAALLGEKVPASRAELAALLQKGVDALPEGVATAHGDSILAAHHLEPLTARTLPGALQQAIEELPDQRVVYSPALDAVLVACFAGSPTVEVDIETPTRLSFPDFCALQRRAAAGGDAKLPSKVYDIPDGVAKIKRSAQLAFPEDGCLVESSASCVRVQLPRGPAVRLQSDSAGRTVFNTATATDVAVAVVRGEDGVLHLQCTDLSGVVTSLSSSGVVTVERADALDSNAPNPRAEALALTGVDIPGGQIPGGDPSPLLDNSAAREVHLKVLPWGAVSQTFASGRQVITHTTGETSERCVYPTGVSPPPAGATKEDGGGDAEQGGDSKDVAAGESKAESKADADDAAAAAAPPKLGWLGCSRRGERWVSPDLTEEEQAILLARAAAEAVSGAAGGSEHLDRKPSAVIVTAGEGKDTETDDAQKAAEEEARAKFAALPKPVAYPSLHAVEASDPDTRATTVTRADHVLSVDFPSGQTLVMLPDETRIVTLPAPPRPEPAEGEEPATPAGPSMRPWMVEGEAMPRVLGNDEGVSVSPSPGVALGWHASTNTIVADVEGAGRIIIIGEVVALSPPGHEVEIEALMEAILDAADEQDEVAAKARKGHAAVVEAARAEYEKKKAEHAELVAAAAAEASKKKKGAAEPEVPELEPFKEPPFVVPDRPSWAKQVACGEGCGGTYVVDMKHGHVARSNVAAPETGLLATLRPPGIVTYPDAPIAPTDDEAEMDAVSTGSPVRSRRPSAGAGAGDDDEGDDVDDMVSEYAASRAPSQFGMMSQASGFSAVSGAGRESDGSDDDDLEIEAEPIAPSVLPRLFVVRPDGSGFEIWLQQAFETLLARRSAHAACRVVEMESAASTGSESADLRAYQFLTQVKIGPRGLPRLPVATTVTCSWAQPPRAAPALRAVSRAEYPPPFSSVVVPRGIVDRLRLPEPDVPPIVLQRCIVTIPHFSERQHAILRRALLSYAADVNEERQRGSHQHLAADTRPNSDIELEREISAQVAKVLSQTESAATALTKQPEQEEEKGEEGPEYVRHGDEYEPAILYAKKRRPWPPVPEKHPGAEREVRSGQVLEYFRAPEGLDALGSKMMMKSAAVAAKSRRQSRVTATHDTSQFSDLREHYGTMPPAYQTVDFLEQRIEVNERQHAERSIKVKKMRNKGAAKEPKTSHTGILGDADLMGPPPETPDERRVGGGLVQGVPGVGQMSTWSQRGSERTPNEASLYDPAGRYSRSPPGPGVDVEAGSFMGAYEDTANPKSRKFTVTGELRTEVDLPPYMRRNAATARINHQHLAQEEGALRMSRTAAGQLLLARKRFTKEFLVTPEQLDFGVVRPGTSRKLKVRIRNVSAEIARFNVAALAPPFKRTYNPGPLAAGMEAVIDVEFGVKEDVPPGGPTTFNRIMEVRSETAVFSIPLQGQVEVARGSTLDVHRRSRDASGPNLVSANAV